MGVSTIVWQSSRQFWKPLLGSSPKRMTQKKKSPFSFMMFSSWRILEQKIHLH
nr:hypothetical protein Iba_scaffold26844CG0010 [Ipomoea batatas]GME21552.1 hypothetical protein Iba_scaffold28274CG0010 [Ipomoea batatas]